MLEVIFIVEESPEGGDTARALRPSFSTEANDWSDLQANVRDAVNCHFDEACQSRSCFPADQTHSRSRKSDCPWHLVFDVGFRVGCEADSSCH